MEGEFKLIMKGAEQPKTGFQESNFYFIRYGGGKGKTRTNKIIDPLLEKEFEILKK